MKIESTVAPVGRSTAEPSSSDPGAVWRAALERALMESLIIVGPRAERAAVPAHGGVAVARSEERLPAAHAMAQRDGQEIGAAPERLRRAGGQEKPATLTGPCAGASDAEPSRASSDMPRAVPGLSKSGMPAPDAPASQMPTAASRSGAPERSVSPVFAETAAPACSASWSGVPVRQASTPMAAISAQVCGPVPYWAAPDPIPRDPVAAVRAAEGRFRSSIASQPEQSPVGGHGAAAPPRTYSARLMQLAQGAEGLRVNVRDASLGPSQVAAVAQAFLGRIDSPQTSISEVYLNGRRFVRLERDAAGAGATPSPISHPSPKED
jgi:hypothetical protein